MLLQNFNPSKLKRTFNYCIELVDLSYQISINKQNSIRQSKVSSLAPIVVVILL